MSVLVSIAPGRLKKTWDFLETNVGFGEPLSGMPTIMHRPTGLPCIKSQRLSCRRIPSRIYLYSRFLAARPPGAGDVCFRATAKLDYTSKFGRKAVVHIRCLPNCPKPTLLFRGIHKHPQFALRRDPESSKSFQEPQPDFIRSDRLAPSITKGAHSIALAKDWWRLVHSNG